MHASAITVNTPSVDFRSLPRLSRPPPSEKAGAYGGNASVTSPSFSSFPFHLFPVHSSRTPTAQQVPFAIETALPCYFEGRVPV